MPDPRSLVTQMAVVRRPLPAAIAVVLKDDAVLLVRRANPPDAGYWGFPGGKIDFGERIEDAAIRELQEETGVRAQAQSIFAAVDAFDLADDGEVRQHYVLIAVLCLWIDGTPRAGDDALDAAWFGVDALMPSELVMSFGVMDLLRQALALAGQR
jgi:ADP-ribose pyrophosphatase YjhB (NUDIX family)